MSYRYFDKPTVSGFVDDGVIFHDLAFMGHLCIVHSLAYIGGHGNPEGKASVFYIF